LIHENGLIHYDIKSENILINNRTVKIIDFEFTEPINIKSKRGSPLFRAPESLNYSIIDTVKFDFRKSDIWSLGIVLYELSNLCPPWDDQIINNINFINNEKLKKAILSCDIKNPVCPYNYINNIMKACLDIDMSTRPTAKELLSKFFNF
jgi:serine/threonine protein kinase